MARELTVHGIAARYISLWQVRRVVSRAATLTTEKFVHVFAALQKKCVRVFAALQKMFVGVFAALRHQ